MSEGVFLIFLVLFALVNALGFCKLNGLMNNIYLIRKKKDCKQRIE